MSVDAPVELRQWARRCLDESDPQRKCELTARAVAALRRGELRLDTDVALEPAEHPGRPPRPQLVPVRQLAQRGFGSVEGRAAFIHAIAHIEFNAVNLAWDAVLRFPAMPEPFYRDWAGVADDEARHFSLLNTRLSELGYRYGDFDAHNGLWEMAEKTAGSCLDRMALVPRVLEARGLDVTPAMIDKLQRLGDMSTAAILTVILNEEVDHVRIGTHWFRWCCAQAKVDPEQRFFELVERLAVGALRRPFNQPARRQAGFHDSELQWIESRAAG